MKLPRRKTFRAVCDGATALALAIIAGVLLCAALAKGDSIEERATVKCIAHEGNGQLSLATGAVFAVADGHGLVVSCAHFLDGSPRVQVWPPLYAKAVDATVVYRSTAMDVSILAFPLDSPIEPTPLATRMPVVGDEAWLVGYPGGQAMQNHRRGNVVSVGRFVNNTSDQLPQIELSFIARPGDSGGPVFSGGEILAVNWGSDFQTFSMAIPAAHIATVFETQCRSSGGCGGFTIGAGGAIQFGAGVRRLVPVYPRRPVYQSPQTYPPQPSYPQPQQPPYQQPPPTQPPAQGSAPPARITPEDLQRLADLIATDGRLRGPQGEPGAAGIPGEPGPPGRDGVNGKDGRNGTNGVNGVDGRDADEGRIAALEAEVAALKEAGVWLKVYDSPYVDARLMDQEFVRIGPPKAVGELPMGGTVPIYRIGVPVNQ